MSSSCRRPHRWGSDFWGDKLQPRKVELGMVQPGLVCHCFPLKKFTHLTCDLNCSCILNCRTLCAVPCTTA